MRRTGPDQATAQLVVARINGMCLRCRQRPGSQIHHRQGRGAGGTRRPETNWPSNLVWVCLPCHQRIESDRSAAYAGGWAVRRNGPDLPSEVPLTDLFGHIFTLTDEGDIVTIARPGQPPF